jgi:hypothetical protein
MTIIRCEYDNVIWDLDVLDEQPIRVDVSAIENDAIGEVFGASSQQFTLPGSKKNNRFFKHAYKVGVTGVPGLGESVRASVITDSNVLLQGSLFLEEVVRTQIDGINYNVIIVNDVVSFNESIKTVAVKDLNWNAYTHSLSVANITGSWDNQLFSGAVYYPLIDQGRDGTETTGSMPNVAIGDGLGFINNSLTPLKVQQLTPAIQVKTVLDKIFERGGFSYSSSLQPLFEQVYILPKQTEDLSVNGSGFGGYRFSAIKTSEFQSITDGDGYVTASINTETLDEGNAYNTTTFTYTVPTTGTYKFDGSFVVEIDPTDPDPQFTGRIRNITTGFTLASEFHSPLTIESTFTVATQDVNVFAGDEIQLQLDYNQGGGAGALESKILESSSFQATVTPRNYEIGVVDLGQQFDAQTKCVDIIKGLVEKFNLVIEPVYTENKVLKIESYNNWIQSGNSKDWTQKVEKAKRIGLRHPLSSQPKTLIFEDNKDNDKLSKLVIDNADGYQWGTEIIDAISDVPQGERKVGSFFSPTILEGVPGSANSLIPQLYKTDDTQQERKTFKFKPRLGYKVNGLLATGSYIGTTAELFQNYATISNYDTLPITASFTKNLHYNDSLYTPTFTSSVNTNNAYNEYWSSYVEDLYQDDNRILNLDLEFTPEELQGIALNDRIFVEDTLYRINKISGYNLVKPDVVNVELIKIKPTGAVLALDCNFNFTAVNTTTTTSTTSTTTQIPIQNWEAYPCDGTGNIYVVRGSLLSGNAFLINTEVEQYYALQPTAAETTAVITSFVSASCAGSTTTTSTTTSALANTFYVNWGPSPGAGYANTATACGQALPNTGLKRFYIYNRTTVPQIQVGDQIYLDAAGTTILTSSFNPWYPIDIVDNGQTTDYVIEVNGTNGQVLELFNCSGTTTTTQAPALLDVYARLLAGTESTTLYYTINGGSQQTLFSGVLDTNCDLIVNDLSLVPGDQIVIYTDENEFIAGQPGVTCPSSVGASTTYTTNLSVGPNEINLTINTQLPTTTTTTTTEGLTQIYSDSQPGSGDLDSCGCEGATTLYNYQILGIYDITQDLTGRTVYEDWDTNTLFFGDDRWYCIATSSAVTPQYSIQINSVGQVLDWAQSVPCTTTTTTTVPPATLEVDGKTLVSSFVSVQYSVNQGPAQTLFETTLGTNCTDLGTITGLEEGDVVDIFEGSSDIIAGALGAGTCPASVGSSTTYQITVVGGTNQVSITISTGATTTTTTTSTTTVPQTTTIYTDATPGNGNLDSCGCEETTTQFEIQVLGNNVDITQDMTGDTIYEDYDTNTLFVGDDKWYCIATSNGVTPQYSIRINNSGIVTEWTSSSPCTTTTTTTIAAASLNVYGRSELGNNSVELFYSVNQGSGVSFFQGPLDTNCSLRDTITGLQDGDVITIYEGTSDFITANNSANNCPLTAQSSTAVNITVGPGVNDISICVDTGFTTTTTTTTTTTVPQVTEIYSDSQPGSGDLDSCGCEGQTTAYNYQVLGNNVDITVDMTGDTIYEDYDTNTLFVGDDKWYCIATSNGVTPQYSIRINNSGIVTDWAQSIPCTTTTTTTTTTLDPNGCYEWEVECLNIGGTCQLDYVDCNGVAQSETLPEGQPGLICARPTPSVTSGTATLQGDCITTTTTSTTTTTTTQAPLVDWDGVGEYATSTLACSEGSILIPNGYKHNGNGTYPTTLDYVYESDGTTPLTAGWYYVSFEDTAIEVEASPAGRVIDKVSC